MEKNKKINEVINLETKRKNIGLTEDEEKILIKLYSQTTGHKEKVFTKEFSEKLTDIIERTDKFINSLKK
jgi:hypothetical protein